MAQNSKIEWTTHTANLWHGCTKVQLAEGCLHCYAETMSKRWKRDIWGNDKPRMAIKSVWKDIDLYQKLAEQAGEAHRVFVGSMMDIFEKPMPVINSKGEKLYVKMGQYSYITSTTETFGYTELNTGHIRDVLFNTISAGEYPNLMFLFLTKRPSLINRLTPASWKENPPRNVMFGTSISDQATADTLVPQLLRVNGKRFLSVEPQLGPINLTHMDVEMNGDTEWCFINALTGKHTDMGRPCEDVPTIHWVIQGGESGHGKRPFNLEWARNMRDQCTEADVPYFFKQIDKIQPIPDDLLIRQFPHQNQNP